MSLYCYFVLCVVHVHCLVQMTSCAHISVEVKILESLSLSVRGVCVPTCGPYTDAQPKPEGGVFAKIRALLFFLISFTLALPLFTSMVIMSPFVLLFDKSK